MFELINPRHPNFRIPDNYFRMQVLRKGTKPQQIQLRLVLWRDSIDGLQWSDESRIRWYLDRAENALSLERDDTGVGSKLAFQSGSHRRVQLVIPTAVAALVFTWADFRTCKKYRAICKADPTTGRLEVRLGEPIGIEINDAKKTETTDHQHTYVAEPFEGGA